MKYKIAISFDGSAYCGWQFQKNGGSVQAAVTSAAARLFGEDVRITGCSRTDSGVHAKYYMLCAEAEKEIPADRVVQALNFYLPQDIAALSCEMAPEEFHPRYDAVSKEYCYLILNRNERDPFLRGRAYHYPGPLDDRRMREQAELFKGKKDFRSFMASGSNIRDTVREVFDCRAERLGDLITLRVRADGFLYNMVRIMAGTLIEAGRGSLKTGVEEIIQAKDRSAAGFTAPPEGLYLTGVEYR